MDCSPVCGSSGHHSPFLPPLLLPLSLGLISRGEGSCERRLGGRSLSASTAQRPTDRPSGRRPFRVPPPPSSSSSSLAQNPFAPLLLHGADNAAAKIRLLAYDAPCMHAGLFKIQKAGGGQSSPRGTKRRLESVTNHVKSVSSFCKWAAQTASSKPT